MADRRIAVITVSSRTIDLAGEIIVIPQIVRLKEIDYAIQRGLSGGRVVLLVVGIALFLGSSLLTSGSRDSGQALLPVLGLLLALGVLLYSFHSRTRYLLAIELASGSLSGLAAKSPAALTTLKDQIQQVIEHPPMQPTAIHVGDVWSVDARGSRGGQFGSGNTQFNN